MEGSAEGPAECPKERKGREQQLGEDPGEEPQVLAVVAQHAPLHLDVGFYAGLCGTLAAAIDMQDASDRCEDAAPAGVPEAPAPIGLFCEHEIAFIHESYVVDSAARDEHEHAGARPRIRERGKRLLAPISHSRVFNGEGKRKHVRWIIVGRSRTWHPRTAIVGCARAYFSVCSIASSSTIVSGLRSNT